MQVANIECQIAQAQLRRYLTGEEMPNSIVNDLETHIKHCPECMTAAQSLRESLKGVLNNKVMGKPAPEPAAVAAAISQAVTKVQSPIDLLDEPVKDFKPRRERKGGSMKTLAYSGALAVLLVLMSTVFKDPTALFGPRASNVKADTPPVTTENTEEPPMTDDQAATTEEPTPVEPSNEVAPAATDQKAVQPGQNGQQPETSTQPDLTKPINTDGLIVADGNTGTKTVKEDPPKPQPKPAKKKPAAKPGNSTLKVYPPDGK